MKKKEKKTMDEGERMGERESRSWVISVRPIQRAFTFDDVALLFFLSFLVCVSDKRVPRCRVLRSLSDRHKRGKNLKGSMGQCPRFVFGGGSGASRCEDNQLF